MVIVMNENKASNISVTDIGKEALSQTVQGIATHKYQSRAQQWDLVKKGADTLNKTKAGQAYLNMQGKVIATKPVQTYIKTSEKIASSKIVQQAKNLGNVVQSSISSKATQKVASKVSEKAATKVAAKVGSKALGKSFLKKIPIISAGVGAYFAFQRIKDKDYAGACAELASGVAGCFPGVGTAVSTAIDVGLAGKDIYQTVQEIKSPEKNNVSSAQQETTSFKKQNQLSQQQHNQKQKESPSLMSELIKFQEKQDSVSKNPSLSMNKTLTRTPLMQQLSQLNNRSNTLQASNAKQSAQPNKLMQQALVSKQISAGR